VTLLITRTLVTEALVDAAPALVLAALDDVPAFIHLNPLVSALERDAHDAHTYLVTDRLRVLGVPLHIRYRARIVRVAEGLDSEVWTSPAIHMENELRVLPEGAGARLREVVRLTAPRLLAAYAAGQAKAAHRALLDRLKARVEAAASRP
jgi:hypothetical protein